MLSNYRTVVVNVVANKGDIEDHHHTDEYISMTFFVDDIKMNALELFHKTVKQPFLKGERCVIEFQQPGLVTDYLINKCLRPALTPVVRRLGDDERLKPEYLFRGAGQRQPALEQLMQEMQEANKKGVL